MSCAFSRVLCSFVVAVASLSAVAPRSSAEELLVYVSAFAAGDEGGIHAFKLDTSAGTLKLNERTGGMEHPFFMALGPKGKFLYAIHAPGKFGGPNNEFVAAYKSLDRNGKLELINRQSALGTAACSLAVDATGKTVLVANYSTGSVASLPVGEDGSLGKAATFVQHAGSSVNEKRQQGPHAHCIVVSPDNRFVYAADLGLDKLLAYRLDAAHSTLSPNQQPFVRTPPGVGPRHLIFDPAGEHVYVVNELTNSVTLFDYIQDNGMLIERQTISTLPENFDGTSYCADLKITPNGRFLYATNRGHDSIAAYRIGEEGRLTLLDIEPSLGKGPQNLAITRDGKLLLCANMPGKNVVLFRIDSKQGTLKPVGAPIVMPGPSCIMIP